MSKIFVFILLLSWGSLIGLHAQDMEIDSLKFKVLERYQVETKHKNKHLNQVMSQLQKANAAIVSDSLESIMKGFPKEFMRQTNFDNTTSNHSPENSDYNGRYHYSFRRDIHQVPDYKKELQASGYR